MQNLQDYTSKLNGFFFWKEFSFHKNNFNPKPDSQLEFADHVIWLDDIIILYQIKEREFKTISDEQSEEKWFENKVLKKAKSQIRNTLKYLNNFETISIENQRGHKFNVKNWKLQKIHKVILFYSDDNLPFNCKSKTHYLSKEAGFIHLFSIDKYFDICNLLITPAEINEYLIFRENVLSKYSCLDNTINEKSILGQFLKGDLDESPSANNDNFVDRFHNDHEEFDISFLFRDFMDHIELIESDDPTAYYKILSQFAKLKRNDLRQIKKLITFCMNEWEEQKGGRPYRVLVPRLQIGFVFFAVHEKYYESRRTALLNFTYAAKYSQKMDKYIGMSIAKDVANPQWHLFEWCYIEEPWVHDDEMENKLKENSPFLKNTSQFLHTYKFQ
jgi:hypothetical protein